MIVPAQYRGKSFGVFGLGKAGQATVRSLLAAGASVYAWDDKEVSDGVPQKADPAVFALTHFSKWPWRELEALVLSPGVPLTHPAPHPVAARANEENTRIIGDIELLSQTCERATFVGITGTNGKSTTTSLIAHILRQAGFRVEVGGNLGTPVLELNPLTEEGIYVIELSSYQLDLIDKSRFNVAVMLNLTPDHLDRHGDMEGYLKAKKRIFMHQQPGDTAIIAVDDAYTQGLASQMPCARVSALRPLEHGVYVQEGILVDTSEAVQATIKSIPTLQGRHNWQNAAAAYAACRALKMAPAAIINAMRSFPGLAHRMERIATVHNIDFVNDSKATNAEATANALAAYEAGIYWIAGGKPKVGGIVSLESFFPKITHAFLIGEAEDEFARTLEGKVSYTRCGTLEKALEAAMEKLDVLSRMGKEGAAAVVLLSPACASFDQFKSFEHRGEIFRQLVISKTGCLKESYAS